MLWDDSIDCANGAKEERALKASECADDAGEVLTMTFTRDELIKICNCISFTNAVSMTVVGVLQIPGLDFLVDYETDTLESLREKIAAYGLSPYGNPELYCGRRAVRKPASANFENR